MEKIVLEFNKKRDIKKKFGNQEISIRPYIKPDEMIGFVQLSMEKQIAEKLETTSEEEEIYFSPTDILMAKAFVDLYIISSCTNVDIEEVDYELMLISGFIQFISEHICNYNMAHEMLQNEIVKYNIQSCFATMINDQMDIENAQGMIDKLGEQMNKIDPSVAKAMLQGTLIAEVKDKTKQEAKDKVKKELKDHKEKLS